MKSRYFSQSSRSPIFRFAAAPAILIALIWNGFAFCDEIHDINQAAQDGKVAKAKALLEHNPNLVFSKFGKDDWTPLHTTAFSGHKDVAELLLANKAQVDAKDDDGRTPFVPSGIGREKRFSGIVVGQQSPSRRQEHTGFTPMNIAAFYGYKDLVELLLANRADVNSKNNVGFTPLDNAAMEDHMGTVELLLANGADVTPRTTLGKTALQLAISHGHTEVAELLRQHGSTGDQTSVSIPAGPEVPLEATGSTGTQPAPTSSTSTPPRFVSRNASLTDPKRQASTDTLIKPVPNGGQAQETVPTATLTVGDKCHFDKRSTLKCSGSSYTVVSQIDGMSPPARAEKVGWRKITRRGWLFRMEQIPITAGAHTVTMRYSRSEPYYSGFYRGDMYITSGNLEVSFVAESGHTYAVSFVTFKKDDRCIPTIVDVANGSTVNVLVIRVPHRSTSDLKQSLNPQ